MGGGGFVSLKQESAVRVCARIFQASFSRDGSFLGAFVSPGVFTTHHLLVGRSTERLSYVVRNSCRSPRRVDALSDSRTRPNGNTECIDPFLIYVHLIYLMSSQKETLLSAVLGLLKDHSTEMPVKILFVKLNKKSLNS